MPRVGSAKILTARLVGRCFSFVLAILLLLSAWCFPAAAEDDRLPDVPQNSGMGSVLLCNLENNQILYEKNADKAVYPSSSVKIMMGLLAARALADRLDEVVTVSSGMTAGVTGRQMYLADGETITVQDLLYAAICGSYNDAAMVLACLTSGSVAAFVNDMNAEAKRLGTTSTYYTNPTGLHDPAMSTSAEDVALIAREALANELYMKVASTRTYTISPTNASPERIFSNRNLLISDSSRNYFNGNCRGMNVGMTDEGGWSLVTVSEKGGAQNLCIILQGADAPSNELIPVYVYANRLLAWGHEAYSYRTILKAGETLDTRSVAMTGISSSKADLVTVEALQVYLPANADVSSLTVTINLIDDKLTAPLAAGQVVGHAAVTYEGHVVGRASLAVTKAYERSGFLDAMNTFRAYLCGRAFWISVAVFLLLLFPVLRMTRGTGGRYGIRDTRKPKPRRRRRYKQSKIRYTKRRF